MKKIILSALVSASLLGASEVTSDVTQQESVNDAPKKSILTFNVGAWYMNWNQTSTSSEMLKNSDDALDMTYNIDSSIAYVLSLKFDYAFLSGSVEYSSDTSSGGKDEESGIENLDVGLAMIDGIPYLNAEVRYTKSNFQGEMNGKKKSGGEYASGNFESKLEIFDLIIYPFNKYVGVGYRTYNYEFPQDAYITADSDGHSVLANLLDLAYEGDFYTIVVDNKKMVDVAKEYNGVVYSFIAGMGKLTPTAGTNAQTSSSDAALYNSFLGESDATFYDLLLGYSYKSAMDNGFAYGLTAGYRYNKIEADASEKVNNNGYSMRTKFDTEFYGPFVNIAMSF